MALNNLGLGFVFTARDLASAKLGQLERNFTNLDQSTRGSAARINASFRQVAVGLGVFAAGAAAVAASFALANAAGEFGQALAQVGAVAGATADELELLRQAAIQAGVATQFSPTEAARGLQNLAQAGLNAREAAAALIPTLDLAAASLGQLGPAEAAGLVTQAMKTFGVAAADVAGAVDQMVRVSNLSAISMEQLQLGLGTASRGALATGQNLQTTLIALGLVKNIVPGVERSATALAVSMERLARPKTQQALRGIGVESIRTDGTFRNFLDVVNDLTSATARMTESQRAAFISQAFGQEASAGLLAIMNQLQNGIRDFRGQVLTGADAVRFLNIQMEAATGKVLTMSGETIEGREALGRLREEIERTGGQLKTLSGVTLSGAEAVAFLDQAMLNAGGAAAAFRERLLDTFEGQKTLLRGTLQTLAITLGEPFAKVFKPIVKAVTDALNFLIRAFQSLPAGVKKAIATFVVAAGAVVALIGGVIAAKAAIALLAVGLKALGITLGGVLATMLPAILIVGLLAATVAGFVIAIKRDLGGIGTFFRRLFDRIKLFVQAMSQLFEDGGFSGAVREELGRAENQGVKQFAIRVFQIVFRIKRFFQGIADGFGAAIEAGRPVFEAFVAALERLGRAFGFVGSAADSIAGLHSDRFAASGARVGEVIGKMVTFIVQALTVVIDLVTGVVEGFRSMADFLGDVFGFLGETFGELGTEIKALLKAMGLIGSQTESSGNAVIEVGRVIGKILGGIVGAIGLALAGVVRIVRAVVRLIRNIGESLGRFVAGIVQLFTDPVEGIKNLLAGLLGFFLSIGDAVLSIFGGGIDDIQKTIDEFGASLVYFFTELIPGWVRDGLTAAGQFFVSIWTGIQSFVIGIVTGIGEIFSGLWNGLVSGVSRVGAFFARVVLGIRGFFVKVGQSIVAFFTESIPNAFRTIVNGIKSFFEPVVEFIRGIFRSIANAVDSIIAFLGRLAAKIPSRFRPSFLDRVVEQGEAATARIAGRERDAAAAAARLAGPAEPRAAAPVSEAALTGRPLVFGPPAPTVPAAAEARARAQSDAALIDAIVASGTRSAEAAERASTRPINVRLDVDGDTIARTTVRANREAAARSFAPVPAT